MNLQWTNTVLDLSVPSSKYRTNYTLVIFQPYALGRFYDHVNQRDAEIDLAVQEINRDSEILPHTYVNLVRVNNWQPDMESVESYDTIDSGGYAVLAAINISQSNANAVVGEYFSKTALYSLEVFSYYQIPFCGADLPSVTFSDMIRYPYFFRMGTGSGFGDYIAQLLLYWKVKRVALVFGFDAESVAGGRDVANSFKKHGINVITLLTISRESFLRHDYTEGYKILRDVDARYIILLANPDTTADFYHLSRKHSLINERHVWIGWQNPIPDGAAENITSIYGPEAYDALQGYIYITPNPSGFQSNQFRQFNKTWTKLMDISPRYQPIKNRISSVGLYDCVKTLLIGVHKFMEANPQYTPEMLVNNSFRSLLTPLIFANTGYEGITADPIVINPNGDLDQAQLFISMNSSFFLDNLPWDETTGFGKTDSTGSMFIPLSNQPIFYGGGIKPPPDGLFYLPPEPPSVIGISLLVLGSLGILSSVFLIAFIIYNRKRRTIASMSPFYTIIFIIGTMLVDGAIISTIGEVNSLNCYLRSWGVMAAGFITFGSLLVKNSRLYILFYHKKYFKFYHRDDVMVAIFCIMVGLGLALIVAWTLTIGDPHTFSANADNSGFVHVCTIKASATNTSNSIITLVDSTFLASFTLFSSFTLVVFVSSSFGLQVNLATFALRLFTMWAVNFVNKAFLIIPKLVAMRYETTYHYSSNELTLVEKTGLQFPTKSLRMNFKIESESQIIPHLKLGGAYISYRFQQSYFWSSWKDCGMIVFSKDKTTWIVIDFDDGALAVRLSENDKLEVRRTIVRLQIENEGGDALKADLEFRNVHLVQRFCEGLENAKGISLRKGKGVMATSAETLRPSTSSGHVSYGQNLKGNESRDNVNL
ncbi:hypothetical protein HDU76_011561 [Blyttiomyces sp. JEL0837]|nr:hypothetical protein HDU76_011561 [Blyttiomyces sp. JEL0837]